MMSYTHKLRGINAEVECYLSLEGGTDNFYLSNFFHWI